MVIKEQNVKLLTFYNRFTTELLCKIVLDDFYSRKPFYFAYKLEYGLIPGITKNKGTLCSSVFRIILHKTYKHTEWMLVFTENK